MSMDLAHRRTAALTRDVHLPCVTTTTTAAARAPPSSNRRGASGCGGSKPVSSPAPGQARSSTCATSSTPCVTTTTTATVTAEDDDGSSRSRSATVPHRGQGAATAARAQPPTKATKHRATPRWPAGFPVLVGARQFGTAWALSATTLHTSSSRHDYNCVGDEAQ